MENTFQLDWAEGKEDTSVLGTSWVSWGCFLNKRTLFWYPCNRSCSFVASLARNCIKPFVNVWNRLRLHLFDALMYLFLAFCDIEALSLAQCDWEKLRCRLNLVAAIQIWILNICPEPTAAPISQQTPLCAAGDNSTATRTPRTHLTAIHLWEGWENLAGETLKFWQRSQAFSVNRNTSVELKHPLSLSSRVM